MKKLLFLLSLLTCVCLCVSCDREDDPLEYERPSWEHNDYQRPSGESGNDDDEEERMSGNQTQGDNTVTPNANTATITKLYSVVMRRTLPYPFQVYVLQINNSDYFYMLRYRFNQDLKVGDKISFAVYKYSPNEIAQINGCDLGDGSEADTNTDTSAGEYWVASDPIEARVKSMFDMKVCYSIPFLPFDTRFIETTDGNLIFVKKSKLKVNLNVGDRFVYNVYTLFPNEVLAIKKL